jgi:threonine dehydratase
LSAEVPDVGVLAASGGNFGLAVAYAAGRLGHRAEIFVPDSSPPIKARRIVAHGAEVRIVPGYYDDSLAAATERAAESGALVLHAFDQSEVVAGQGTVGAELADQVPDANTVLVAIGGGGLIGGVAAWYRARSGWSGGAGRLPHDVRGPSGRPPGPGGDRRVRGRLAGRPPRR